MNAGFSKFSNSEVLFTSIWMCYIIMQLIIYAFLLLYIKSLMYRYFNYNTIIDVQRSTFQYGNHGGLRC